MSRIVEIPVELKAWLKVEVDDDDTTAVGIELLIDTVEHDAGVGVGIDRGPLDGGDGDGDLPVEECERLLDELTTGDYLLDGDITVVG